MIKIPPIAFTWEKWRAGSYYHLNLLNGHIDIISPEGKKIIRNKAFGYCDGSKLSIRPKSDTMAVMFFDGNETFWSHITSKEFGQIFGDLYGK